MSLSRDSYNSQRILALSIEATELIAIAESDLKNYNSALSNYAQSVLKSKKDLDELLNTILDNSNYYDDPGRIHILELAMRNLQHSLAGKDFPSNNALAKSSHYAKVFNAINSSYYQFKNLKDRLELNPNRELATSLANTDNALISLIAFSDELFSNLHDIYEQEFTYFVARNSFRDSTFRCLYDSSYESQYINAAPVISSSDYPIASSNVIPNPSTSFDNLSASPYLWGIGGVLLGLYVVKPVAHKVISFTYKLKNVLSMAAEFFTRQPVYHPIAQDEDDNLVVDIEDPISEVDLEAIKSNNELTEKIKLLAGTSLQLLSKEEIALYESISGIKSYLDFKEKISCSIGYEPMHNPINVKLDISAPEGKPGARFWQFTADAETLIAFIEQCSKNRKLAFSPSTRDLLNSDEVEFSSGLGSRQDESSLVVYANNIKRGLTMWKHSNQRIGSLEQEFHAPRVPTY